MLRYWIFSGASSSARGSVAATSSMIVRSAARCSSSRVVVVVADDQYDFARPASPLTSCGWMNPSRPSVVSGESAVLGQPNEDLAEELQRVHELPFAPAGMHRASADRQLDAGRREGLVVQLARRRPVERVGRLGAEALDVEVVRAAPDLLVGVEPDPQRPVRDLGMLEQVADGRHDLRDARLVVRAEQGRSVGRDQLVADVVSRARASPPA